VFCVRYETSPLHVVATRVCVCAVRFCDVRDVSVYVCEPSALHVVRGVCVCVCVCACACVLHMSSWYMCYVSCVVRVCAVIRAFHPP